MDFLEVGHLANYWRPGIEERTVLITKIEAAQERLPKRYIVVDCESWNEFSTFGCWLKPVKGDSIITDIFEDIENVSPNASIQQNQDREEIKPASEPEKRFGEMSTEQLDVLAGASRSSNTNEQTKWGIRIFRGKQLVSVDFIRIKLLFGTIKWLYIICL